MISCYYFRTIIKRSLDTDKTLPPRVARHIQNCSGCRKVHESETGVIRELRGTAVKSEESPFLHASIMSSIARSGSDAEVKPCRRPSIWAVGLATACLLLLAILLMRQRPVPD